MMYLKCGKKSYALTEKLFGSIYNEKNPTHEIIYEKVYRP